MGAPSSMTSSSISWNSSEVRWVGRMYIGGRELSDIGLPVSIVGDAGKSESISTPFRPLWCSKTDSFYQRGWVEKSYPKRINILDLESSRVPPTPTRLKIKRYGLKDLSAIDCVGNGSHSYSPSAALSATITGMLESRARRSDHALAGTATDHEEIIDVRKMLI